MAKNLLASGTSVAAFDLSQASLDAVASAGGVPVTSVADLKDCETIITMLPSSPHVEETVGTLLDAGWKGKVRKRVPSRQGYAWGGKRREGRCGENSSGLVFGYLLKRLVVRV